MSSYTSSSRRYAIIFLCLFVASMVTFVVTTEIFVRLRVLPNSTVEHLKEQLHDPSLARAAIGDSRLRDGINSTPELVNLSYAGNTLNTILGVARTFADLREHPVIILQAAPHFFARYRMVNDQQERLSELRGEFTSPLAILRPHIRQYLISYWRAALSNPGKLFGYTKEPPVKAVQPVSTWQDVAPKERRRKASIRAQLQAPISGFENSPLAARFEASVAKLATESDLCLVSLPTSADFRHFTPEYDGNSKIQIFYAEIASRYNIPYLDLSDADYPDTLFSNADHMNMAGAERFKAEVISFCRIPMDIPEQ